VTNLFNILKTKYREIGLAAVIAIYAWAYLTAKDPFWAGRATFFSMIVVFVVALFEIRRPDKEV